MLKNTIAVIDKTIYDIKGFVQTVQHGFYIIAIVPPLYSALTAKYLWANIPFLILSILHYIFFILTYGKKDKKTKELKKSERKTYKIAKKAIKSVVLLSTILALYSAMEKPDIFLVASALITAITWVFTLIIELISTFVENRKNMIVEALIMDVETITKPVTTVIDKVTHIFNPDKEIFKKENSNLQHRYKIQKTVEKRKEKLEQKKLAKALEKAEAKKQKSLVHK